MAKYGINLGINVKAIDKARLQAKGDKIWLNATVFFDPDNADNYGQNGMITQDVTKEEKDNGVKGNILGNVKLFWRDEAPRQEQGYQGADANGQEPPDDGCPF